MASTDPGVQPSKPPATPPVTTPPPAAQPGGSTAADHGWVWVTNTKDLNANDIFTVAQPSGPNYYYHPAVDIETGSGSPVYAPQKAKVTIAGWATGSNATPNGGFGQMIQLQMEDGSKLWVIFGHLSKILVGVGDTVTAGEQIGVTGNTGNSTGPHLHFQISTSQAGGSYINPVTWFASLFAGLVPVPSKGTQPPATSPGTPPATTPGTPSTNPGTGDTGSTGTGTTVLTGSILDPIVTAIQGIFTGKNIEGGVVSFLQAAFGVNYVLDTLGFIIGLVLVIIGLYGLIQAAGKSEAGSQAGQLVKAVIEKAPETAA